MSELEAKAVAEATASADESFSPSPSLLNASSPEALLQQVDGPSLASYEAKESVYVGKSVPVAGKAKLEVPIHVTAPGSIVEYSVDSKTYDIKFSVEAEREEGITIVKVSWFCLHCIKLRTIEKNYLTSIDNMTGAHQSRCPLGDCYGQVPCWKRTLHAKIYL